MEQRLSIITLGVGDLQRSRAFYESLGWKVASEEQADSIVAFNLQSFVLALYPLGKFEEETGRKPDPASPPRFTLAHNVASEAEVDRVIGEARGVGAEIVKEPQKVFWGGYSGYFADPDGHLWEVAFNPYSSPAGDGSFKWG